MFAEFDPAQQLLSQTGCLAPRAFGVWIAQFQAQQARVRRVAQLAAVRQFLALVFVGR